MADRRLIDVPIELQNQESLGIGMYADVLAEFIRNVETPITIGIQGDWGVGKTSLLNMVKEQLKPVRGRREKYHIIYFNTWQYSQFKQDELLGLSILKGIMEEIQSLDTLINKDADTYKNALNTFGKFVSNLGNQIIQKQTGVDIKKAISDGTSSEAGIFDNDLIASLRKMKGEFRNLISQLLVTKNDKFVIMIDDLDRIKPVKALEFLEAIKNFLDVENCVFVMAVDYTVIQSGMEEKLGKSAQELQGKSYFDKIIQVPFNMPVSSYKTDKYIISLLGWDYDEINKRFVKQKRDNYFLKIRDNTIDEQVCDFFTNVTSLTVGMNPRGIKRAVNYATLLKMIVESKRKIMRPGRNWTLVDAKILFSLSCMQLSWPEVFVHFSEKPSPKTIHRFEDFEFLSNLAGIDALFKRVYNPEETKSNISGFFDEFISLVDTDGNGQIDSNEFRPIWEIMYDANLTASKQSELEDKWSRLAKMIYSNMQHKDSKYVNAVLGLFRIDNSRWNDPARFNLLGAGKKFVNMLWDGKQVGSIVSTNKEPIQIYYKLDPQILMQNLPSEYSELIIDVKNIGHYGTGDSKINIEMLLKLETGVKFLNSINKIIETKPKESE